MMPKRFIGALLAVVMVSTGCSVFGGGDEGRTITAEFSRAVQMFPGNSVRVLGVDVGRVTDVEQGRDSVEVTFRIDDSELKLPADVNATIVPVSLLGERYVQLFPAYDGGEEFTSDRLAMENTSVPTEQDELLRGLQDYFGALDPTRVAAFVTDVASVLDKNGQNLNDLINYGSGVITTLSRKRDSLAKMFQELNTITQALATRQEKIGRLIHSYNSVTKIVNENRTAVEGTIEGLNLAAAELASLLIDHRNPLGADIQTLTRTSRTLDRNVHRFARTGHWAKRLFGAARRAVDYKEDWLRLSNQGGQLVEMALFRLRDRIVGVCLRLKLDDCEDDFLEEQLPDLFCQILKDCDLPKPPTQQQKQGQQQPPPAGGPAFVTPGEALEETLKGLEGEVGEKVRKELGIRKNCDNAPYPRKCRKLKRRLKNAGGDLDKVIKDLQEQAGGGLGDLSEGGLLE
jgi:phospholipid/cholesterol/gamma-HCH transport system substrate-binding protein